MNTADFLSRLESQPNEKVIPKINEGIPTQPIEVTINSTGIAQKDQAFSYSDHVEMPSGEYLWPQKQKKLNFVRTELSVITVSHCHVSDKCINIPMHNVGPLKKVHAY